MSNKKTPIDLTAIITSLIAVASTLIAVYLTNEHNMKIQEVRFLQNSKIAFINEKREKIEEIYSLFIENNKIHDRLINPGKGYDDIKGHIFIENKYEIMKYLELYVNKEYMKNLFEEIRILENEILNSKNEKDILEKDHILMVKKEEFKYSLFQEIKELEESLLN